MQSTNLWVSSFSVLTKVTDYLSSSISLFCKTLTWITFPVDLRLLVGNSFPWSSPGRVARHFPTSKNDKKKTRIMCDDDELELKLTDVIVVWCFLMSQATLNINAFDWWKRKYFMRSEEYISNPPWLRESGTSARCWCTQQCRGWPYDSRYTTDYDLEGSIIDTNAKITNASVPLRKKSVITDYRLSVIDYWFDNR